jgi:predicted lactoylglutathione lyase
MTKEIWIKLKDINRSKTFFTRLDFRLTSSLAMWNVASLVIGDQRLAVNLFTTSTFEKFSNNKIAETRTKLQKYCFPSVRKAEKK